MEVVLFFFDQLITSSKEFTRETLLPPIDLWISWFTVSILLVVRDSIFLCSNLTLLNQLLKSQLSTMVTTHKLQVNLEQNFTGALRSRLISSKSALNSMLGFDHRLSQDQAGYDRFWDKSDQPAPNEEEIAKWEIKGANSSAIDSDRWKMRERMVARGKIDSLMHSKFIMDLTS
jgi:hypothetical protein